MAKGNPNYRAGRLFEYETIRDYRAIGYSCIRASGSHGEYDLVAYRKDCKPVLVQCKRVSKASEAKRLGKVFSSSIQSSPYYYQCLRVKVKGSKGEPIEVTI